MVSSQNETKEDEALYLQKWDTYLILDLGLAEQLIALHLPL